MGGAANDVQKCRLAASSAIVKIALIRSAVHRHGGVERYVWHLAEELDRRGHEVHLIVRRRPEPPSPSVRFHTVPVAGIFSFSKVLSFARGVKKVLEKEYFDIVHSCERIHRCDVYRAGEGLHREWLRVSSLYLSPWAQFIRNLDPLHNVLLKIEENLIRHGGARFVMANSRKGAEEIRKHFGTSRASVIYNGVDSAEFRPPRDSERKEMRGRIHLAESDFAVLYVGSGFFRKGLRYLIEGFAKMGSPQNGKKPYLLILGRGARGTYERLIRAHGLSGRVRFFGDEISAAQLYQAADVFVFPTLYDPFANVCLEALASGLPCVLSSRNGAAEIISDGKEGYILDDPTDTDDIARLASLCMDEEKAAAMGEAARALSLKFTWRANADETEKLYRKILLGEGVASGT